MYHSNFSDPGGICLNGVCMTCGSSNDEKIPLSHLLNRWFLLWTKLLALHGTPANKKVIRRKNKEMKILFLIKLLIIMKKQILNVCYIDVKILLRGTLLWYVSNKDKKCPFSSTAFESGWSWSVNLIVLELKDKILVVFHRVPLFSQSLLTNLLTILWEI